MRKLLRKQMVGALSLVLAATPLLLVTPKSAEAAVTSTAIPQLLITELIPDTSNFAGYDAFEYVEVYNNSSATVDLKNYAIKAGSWSSKISESYKLGPWETGVVWTRRGEISPLGKDAFNSYYFLSYASKHVPDNRLYVMEDVGGFTNSGTQTVTIINPDGTNAVTASYTATDVKEGKTITYRYPASGGTAMQKIAGSQEPTPGRVDPGQAPAKPKLDQLAPQAPAGLAAAAGGGEAALTWAANPESDVLQYNIYKNGSLEYTVPAAQTQFTASLLTGNVPVTFEVSAVDTSDNESARSAAVPVTPSHQQITQSERSVNPESSKYQALWNISSDGPVIPGLAQDAVPQGIGYYAANNWILTVSYMEDGRPGPLSIVDNTTGQLVKTVHLYNEDGTPYVGHAGGISVSRDNAWIASGKNVFQVRLADLINAQDNSEVRFAGRVPLPVKASYNSFADGVLWVGEFYESKSYPTDPSHHITNRDGVQQYAWTAGFRLDPVTDTFRSEKWNGDAATPAVPDYLLSTTDKVQGISFMENSIVLSQSYGRNNDSALYRYNNPLQEPAHATGTVGTTSVPLWFLDGQSAKATNSKLTIVPMSESIVPIGNELFVLLESGANTYRYTTTYVMDRMLKINWNQWDQM
ncbi:lamin tail domain-containing protein [Paenibacillus lutrae]|uniref:Lamin tail domain-containing protein n=1 Tax=Paenibacillus lutrae TaxID=2078573 RepID=A0A7X3FFZ4_9BACL|nr:lamin tail domain-containing protein [Paenibacillus lutrae]MVO99070.1 lamin tail domain-containing protein [Paenibacillus lutrae]